jgi:hypothetical protein
MHTDGLFQLLDVLGATLSKGRLGLTVPLLPLFGSSIDLNKAQVSMMGIPSAVGSVCMYVQID